MLHSIYSDIYITGQIFALDFAIDKVHELLSSHLVWRLPNIFTVSPKGTNKIKLTVMQQKK